MAATRPRPVNHRVLLAVLVMAAMSYGLMQSMIVPAIPVIERELGASKTAASWLLTAFLLAGSVATPILGRLGDMYGKDRMLVLTLALLTAGTVISALATSVELMIVGRVVGGAGAGVFPLGFAIVRDELPRDQVAQGVGIVSSLFGLGGALGGVLAGPIIDALSYHWIFWLPAVVSSGTMIAAHLLVPASPVRTGGRVNWLAAVLLSIGLVTTLLAVSQGGSWGWTSARTLGTFALGAGVTALWVRTELRSREPLVDMRIMRLRGVWTTNLVTFLIGMGMYIAIAYIPQYVQEPAPVGFGSSVVQAGIFLLPQTLGLVVVGLFTGRIERRIGSRVALMLGGAVFAAGMLLLAVSGDATWEIYVACTTVGAGCALLLGSTPNLIVDTVRQEETGVATGVNAVTRTVGGSVGTTLGAAAIAAHVSATGAATSSGYALTFWIAAVALVVGLVTALLIPRRRRAAAVPVLAPEIVHGGRSSG